VPRGAVAGACEVTRRVWGGCLLCGGLDADVSPEKVEGIYGQHAAVNQVWIHGDSLHRFVVAFVVAEEGSENVDPAILLSELQALGKDAGLHSFEQAKRVHITTEAFTVENHLITPTMKLRRHDLRQQYVGCGRVLFVCVAVWRHCVQGSCNTVCVGTSALWNKSEASTARNRVTTLNRHPRGLQSLLDLGLVLLQLGLSSQWPETKQRCSVRDQCHYQ